MTKQGAISAIFYFNNPNLLSNSFLTCATISRLGILQVKRQLRDHNRQLSPHSVRLKVTASAGTSAGGGDGPAINLKGNSFLPKKDVANLWRCIPMTCCSMYRMVL